MSPIFENWVKSEPMITHSDKKHCAALAWDACKQQILNLIKKERTYIMPEDELALDYLDKDDLINKIEKL